MIVMSHSLCWQLFRKKMVPISAALLHCCQILVVSEALNTSLR